MHSTIVARSLIPAASRSTTSAMRAARTSGQGGRIDPAEIRLAIELRQRIEECGRRRVGLERRGDIVGQIAALRTFRGQFYGHLIADRDAHAVQALWGQGQRPPGAGRQSLARIRQPSIVPPTGWSALAPHASSGSNGIVMTALSPGPAAMTARKRCEPMPLIVARQRRWRAAVAGTWRTSGRRSTCPHRSDETAHRTVRLARRLTFRRVTSSYCSRRTHQNCISTRKGLAMKAIRTHKPPASAGLSSKKRPMPRP